MLKPQIKINLLHVLTLKKKLNTILSLKLKDIFDHLNKMMV